MKTLVDDRLVEAFGAPSRDVLKVKSWDLSPHVGVVLQVDQPNRENAAYLWVPYPGDDQAVPEIALEYPAEAGRHSGTYPAAGLKRGEPALKLTIRNTAELDEVVHYIRAMASNASLHDVKVQAAPNIQPSTAVASQVLSGEIATTEMLVFIDLTRMPQTNPIKQRREAIPRVAQREVWQRDGGRCVECSTRERLCFDHIVPFSKGGGNSIRNLQLLCETCNLRKSNRI